MRYIWLIFMLNDGVHVSEYTSPMDGMGLLELMIETWINCFYLDVPGS